MPIETLYPSEDVGFGRRFTGFDLDANTTFTFDATVRHVSPNAVWYFPADADVDSDALAAVADAFERTILPGVLRLVLPGQALPGKVAVVHGPFSGVGGYFSSGDALPRAVRRHSNERVSIYLNDGYVLNSNGHLATLAHELQHLVHWMADPTESTWVHEGFSEFAARSLGYGGIPFTYYRAQPEVSIRDWPTLDEDLLPNYAGAALFSTYLAERLGVESIAAIAAQQTDGSAGVQAELDAAHGGIAFEDLFVDWLAANASGGDTPPYGYGNAAPAILPERTLDEPDSISGEAGQMGAWLLRIEPDAPLNVTFAGKIATPLLPTRPHSGDACWWSNTGDSIHATLTRAVGLTGVATAALRFRAWWDIEEHWDRGYVSVSTDGGASWRILHTESATTHDPFRVAFGPSYTGASRGWRLESADLTPFAGREALLRFDYLTDDAIAGSGWCVDDIAIPEIGLFDDAETDGAWQADGFTRTGGASVRQRFVIRLIEGKGDSAAVKPVPVDGNGAASFLVERPVTMVVTAFAPKTSEPARFEVQAERAPEGGAR